MATQVAGNVNADHEISSQQRNNQQATNRIRHNTMEHADGNFRHNNSSGEGVSGPPDGAVNNVLGSPGQPPGGGGSDIGTKAAAVAGMNANMNQDGGQQQSQTGGMTTTQQPGSNPNMDPFSSGGGGMQPNNNMPNQLMDNPGGKPGSNMGGTEGYNGGYYSNRGGNYGMVGQHGGHGQAGNVPPSSSMNMNMGPNQGQNMPNTMNNSYSQFDGHMGPRPGYPSMSMGSRTGPNMPPNYGSHQRPYGENRIANSAPTLSQLLQGQKQSPSYSSNYSNQGDSLGKGNDGPGGMGMMGNPGGYPSQWGQSRGGMPSSMAHGMGPGGGYPLRNQLSMMADGAMGQKRGYPGSPYPQAANQYGGRQYGNMSYPMGSRGQNMPPNSMGGNQYQQNMPSQQNQQQQPQPNQPPNQQQGPGYGRGQQSQPPTPGKPPTPNQVQQPPQQPPQQQQQQSQSQQQPPQQTQQQQQGQQQQSSQKTSQQPQAPNQQQQQQQQQPQQQQSGQTTNEETSSNRPPSLPDLSGSLDDLSTGNEFGQNLPNSSQSNTAPPSSQANNDSYSTSSASQSPHMHPSVSALRPSPSPVGSPASHLSRSSLSPASVPGGSVTPQPPMVPPSSQSESSSHNQMSQSPLGSQPENRGNFNRYPGGYPTSSSSGPHGNYPQNPSSGMNYDRMRAGGVTDGFNNSQYGYGNSGNAPNPGPNMNSRSPSGGPSYGFNQSDRTDGPQSGPTPPPNMTAGTNPTGPAGSPAASVTPKGAQAAAAAAIMAAANTAANKPMYHRTLQQPQQPGQPPHQRYPPPYQQQPPPSQWQQNAGYPTSGGPGGPHPFSSVPNSMPNSMPGSGPPHMPSNSMGGNMPPGALPLTQSSMPSNQMPMNSMPNSMGGPNSGPGMMGQAPPSSTPGSAPSSATSSLTDTSEPPISAMGAMASAVAASDTSSHAPTTTVANSVAGAVATTVTQSITSPVTTATVTSSGTGNVMKTEIKSEQLQPQPQPQPPQQPQQPQSQQPQPQQPHPQGHLQPQQVQLVKEESGYGPSSPPIGLLGASPAPLASPGATSKSSQDEGDSRGSPSVSKIPASPVSRAHAGSSRRSSKNLTSQDVMQRQAELDEHPERRPFLERLFSLMEERNQPIKTMPQISTHTLDLFKLYYAVKEKGGVVKVSKAKQWKAIATYLAVGSSNSAAFTLKKNYLRYLLQFECVNDLGNIDPQRIVMEIEAMTKKKSSSSSSSSSSSTVDHSAAASAAATAAGQHMMPMINSHDGFPRPGGRVNQMYPAQSPMHNNMPGMHPRGSMGPGMPGMPNDMTANSVTVRDPFADADYSNNAQQGQYSGMGQNSMDGPYRPGVNSMNQFRSNSMTGNDPYSAMGNRGPQGNDPYNSGIRNSGMPQGNDPYNRQNMGTADGFNRRTPMSGAETFPGNNRGGAAAMGMNQGGTTGQQYPYGSGTTPFDRESYDQQRQHMAPSPSSAAQPPSQSGMMPPYPNNSSGDQSMYQPSSRFGPQGAGSRPGTPNDSHTRPPYPNNQQQSPQQGIFPGNDQIRPQFPQKRTGDMYGPPGKRPEFMNQQPPMSRPDDFRGVAPFSQASNFPQQGAYPGDRHMGGQGSFPPGYRDRGPGTAGHGHSMRPGPATGASPSPSWGTMHQRHQSPYVGSTGGPRTLTQALMAAAHRERQSKMMGKPSPPPMSTQMPPKKEIIFPPDSVEATQPKLAKSKRKNSKDIGPVEAWRLMMSLKSGLLAESTWALDVLNILLFDNSTIMYFDLAQLQGLLEILVDHFRASLKQVFDTFGDLEMRTQNKAIVNFTWEEIGVDLEDLNEDMRKRRKDGPESEVEVIKQALESLDVEKLKGVDKVKSLGLDETLKGYYEHEKRWDTFEGFLSNKRHWSDGRGDMTGHIMHVFENNGLVGEPPNKARKVENTEDKSCEVACKIKSEDCAQEDAKLSKVESSEFHHTCKVEPVDNEDQCDERTENVSSFYDDDDESEEKETVVEEDEDNDVPLWQRCCSEELRLVKKKERQDASKGVIMCYHKTAQDEEDPPLEEEGTCRDNSVLVTCTDGQKELTRRCLCLSNIVRSLSFIPGNDTEMANHPGLLSLLGRLLLLQHRHGIRRRNPQTYNRDDKDDLDTDILVTDEDKWWWDCLENMRENALVTITNISGHLDLSLYPESISLPILDGLLHWSICLSASALDPFPSRRTHSLLSPKRLAIEALAKLSIQDNNVDMILATPPFQRLDRFFATLTQYLGDRKKPVMREFSIVLLSSLAQGDSIASRAIALQNSVISLLLCYMEDSEYAKTLEAGSTSSQLSQNPDIQPASPDMMRRAALTLACMARVPENQMLFLQHQGRLLNLTMSPAVHDVVKKHLSDVLFEVGAHKL